MLSCVEIMSNRTFKAGSGVYSILSITIASNYQTYLNYWNLIQNVSRTCLLKKADRIQRKKDTKVLSFASPQGNLPG